MIQYEEEFDSVRDAERTAVKLANLNRVKVNIDRLEVGIWKPTHHATVWPKNGGK
jgi:hypothetical protein